MEIKDYLISEFKLHEKEIILCKKIHTSLNESYFVKIKNRCNSKFFVKKYQNIHEPANYEKYHRNLIIKVDTHNKILICRWLQNKSLKNIQKKLIKIIKEIDILHNSKTKFKNKINFKKIHANLLLNYEQSGIYFNLLEKYKTDKLVFSHNDINKNNVLFFKDEIYLIDFEHSSLAPEYFDYAQICAAENIRPEFMIKKYNKALKNSNLELTKLIDYCFIAAFFCLSWCHYQKIDSKIRAWQAHYENYLKKWISKYKNQ